MKWDGATAGEPTINKFIEWLAEWLCYRKYVVEFEASMYYVDVELGDHFYITDHPLVSSGMQGTTKFVVFHVEHNINEDKMKFKAMQMPELLP